MQIDFRSAMLYETKIFELCWILVFVTLLGAPQVLHAFENLDNWERLQTPRNISISILLIQVSFI